MILLGLFIFSIYVATLYTTVPGGDAGELITVVYSGGVVHPPGYPLYTILAKLMTYFPLGSIAWRVNLLSAICDSLAAIFLMRAVVLWTGNFWSGVISAGLFAFSPLVWSYAISAEVFALNNLFVCIALFLLVKYETTESSKIAYLSAFIYGLALSNHHTFLFYGVCFALCILWFGKKKLWTVKDLSILAGLFLIGFLPYLYLPFASARDRFPSWGVQTTWDGFWNHFFRADFGTFQLGSTPLQRTGEVFERLISYLSDLFSESLYLGPFIAWIGILSSMKKKMRITIGLLIAFFLYAWIFHFLANNDYRVPIQASIQARFWQQLNILIFFWIGIGLCSVLKKKHLRWVSVCLIGLQLILHYSDKNKRNDTSIRDFARAILYPLPINSILLTEGDLNYNAVIYVQNCEGYRKDVKVIPQNLLSYTWYNQALRKKYPDLLIPSERYRLGKALLPLSMTTNTYSISEFISSNQSRFSIYMVGGFHPEDIQELNQSFVEFPFGLTQYVVEKDKSGLIHSADLIQKSQETFQLLDLNKLAAHSPGEWEYIAYTHSKDALERFKSAVHTAQ